MTSSLRAAEEALWLTAARPSAALERAYAVLDAARGRGEWEAVAVARRAVALAARELGDLALAERQLRAVVEEGGGVPERRVAQARLSLVTVRTEMGHPEEALEIAVAAEPCLGGSDVAKLASQRAVALVALGRLDEAAAQGDLAVEALMGAAGPPLPEAGTPEADDLRFLVGALLNRAVVSAYLGRHGQAEEDLERCLALGRAAGLGHLVALAEADRPFLAARRGDVPLAFARYREAEVALRECPERLAMMRCDLAAALLSIRLPGEARALLDLAVPELEAAGARGGLADARLLLARLELLASAPHAAAATAERAAADLKDQGRAGMLPLADDIMLRARLAIDGPCPELVARMSRCAGDLADARHHDAAAHLRLAAVEAALRLGERATARRQLDDVAAEGEGPVRAHALALARDLDGDTRGAFDAVAKGLAEVGGSATHDPLARAYAVRAGERLAEFGLTLALRGGVPENALEWAERWRSVAATGRPGAPGLDGLRAVLGADGAVVEYVRHGAELTAIVVTSEGVTVCPLGPMTPAAEAVARLQYALRRQALGDAGPPGEPGVAMEEAASVEEVLLGPLAEALPPCGPVAIVPTGALYSLPWPVLPGLRERPVCVAPSAGAWLAAARTPPRGEGVAVVAGPGLAHGRGEAAAVLGCHRGARPVAARSGPVLRALDSALVVHLAAHGFFDARSPMLSSIDLDDGPLMAYDLCRLRTPAWLVVLSACEVGLSRTPADGAVLGLAGTFLARGTACVVAGLVPVRDDDTATLMAVFHDLLAAGHPPAHALTAASAKTGVFGFACLGAGFTALPGA
ncbi:tetratricopeptide (TPR) repeat protein [Thermocatellispora tengchongensis]|uniref:Tetratricopeptide (TPR) repeat protein n=1 Tax=Thermocatellispora tengchongensis TaxID=1073253 RepID=A0A840PGQ0_9ACTN|nr:CHAT domain-containing protein [Thermocatellispora tengchongensis]MBB5135215.1 tetratricopeptide (TPR) repeat protein [Thermocatellispora tengchongensis]